MTIKSDTQDSVKGQTSKQFSGPIRTVAVLFAMDIEAAPLIERFGLQEPKNIEGREFGFRAYQTKVNKLNLCVLVNGKSSRFGVDNIGTEAAAINSYLAIRNFKPDLLISAGTAGGFASRGSHIGDIYFSEGQVVYHDHRIPIAGFEEYGRGSYPVLKLARLPEQFGAKRGVVSTGNSLDATGTDLALMELAGAAVKDMEAAAIARVCEETGTAFFAVKSITDLADDPNNHNVFLQNYAIASAALGTLLERVLRFLAEGRNFEDL